MSATPSTSRWIRRKLSRRTSIPSADSSITSSESGAWRWFDSPVLRCRSDAAFVNTRLFSDRGRSKNPGTRTAHLPSEAGKKLRGRTELFRMCSETEFLRDARLHCNEDSRLRWITGKHGSENQQTV